MNCSRPTYGYSLPARSPRHITSRVLLRCFRNHKSSQITWVVDLSTFKVDSYGKCGSTENSHIFSPLFIKWYHYIILWGGLPKWKFNWKINFQILDPVLTCDIETWLWSARLASAWNEVDALFDKFVAAMLGSDFLSSARRCPHDSWQKTRVIYILRCTTCSLSLQLNHLISQDYPRMA